MENKIFSVYALCFVKDMGIAVEVQGYRVGIGTGNIVTTGNVGELARDSVLVCKTLLSNLNPKFLYYDYHIHFQYLQLKKDGSSWGLACFMLLCLISDTRIKYPEYPIAATGELDLYGNVKSVLYLKEKINGISDYIKCDNIFIPKSVDDVFIQNKKIHQLGNIRELFE